MMKKFAVIEVGSTNTKSFIYQSGKIIELPQKTIQFKANYKKAGEINKSDFDELCNYVISLKKRIGRNIHVFGTSIFRDLKENEKKPLLTSFSRVTGVEFQIVSQEQESEYTVKGVTLGNDFCGRLAVMIAGGGSTEVCIIENKQIIEKHYNNFGVVDVSAKFPQINDLRPAMTMDEADRFCDSKISPVNNKTNILVIAGGDFITFFEMAGSDFIKHNNLYQDINQPYTVSVSDSDTIDNRYIFEQDIKEYQERKPEYKNWWLGTRAMRFCVRAIVRTCGAQIIIPTKINMCLGIINELKGER